jgi:hypothetical protein
MHARFVVISSGPLSRRKSLAIILSRRPADRSC